MKVENRFQFGEKRNKKKEKKSWIEKTRKLNWKKTRRRAKERKRAEKKRRRSNFALFWNLFNFSCVFREVDICPSRSWILNEKPSETSTGEKSRQRYIDFIRSHTKKILPLLNNYAVCMNRSSIERITVFRKLETSLLSSSCLILMEAIMKLQANRHVAPSNH